MREYAKACSENSWQVLRSRGTPRTSMQCDLPKMDGWTRRTHAAAIIDPPPPPIPPMSPPPTMRSAARGAALSSAWKTYSTWSDDRMHSRWCLRGQERRSR